MPECIMAKVGGEVKETKRNENRREFINIADIG